MFGLRQMFGHPCLPFAQCGRQTAVDVDHPLQQARAQGGKNGPAAPLAQHQGLAQLSGCGFKQAPGVTVGESSAARCALQIAVTGYGFHQGYQPWIDFKVAEGPADLS
jgi:hypothetical protein